MKQNLNLNHKQEEEESIKNILLKNPLFLENNPDIDMVANFLLPYHTGIEIECDKSTTFNKEYFEKIPDIIDIHIDSTEQRFRIPEGLKGLKCLFNICEALKVNSIPNSEAGHHYHIDFTDKWELINKDFLVNVEDYILKELDTWDYQGTYNRRAITLDGGACWVRFQTMFKTMEVRIGNMSFDYNYTLKNIIHCQKIAKELKTKTFKNLVKKEKEKDNKQYIETIIKNRKIILC